MLNMNQYLIFQYRFLKNKNVIYFKIPCYPELATKNVWPLVKQNPDLMLYFPELKHSQLPEKEYLYGVICTLTPDAVRELVAQSVKSRSLENQDEKDDKVEMVEELKESIMNIYSMKSKCNLMFTIEWKSH